MIDAKAGQATSPGHVTLIMLIIAVSVECSTPKVRQVLVTPEIVCLYFLDSVIGSKGKTRFD